eukprot:2248647-Pleurochrysis_carterae.AAC.2
MDTRLRLLKRTPPSREHGWRSSSGYIAFAFSRRACRALARRAQRGQSVLDSLCACVLSVLLECLCACACACASLCANLFASAHTSAHTPSVLCFRLLPV